jgi:hypothetical protein
MSNTSDNLDALKKAADDYFTSEKKRLNAEFSFLDAISKKRGGAAGLQDANAQGASQILIDSINSYLGSPLSGEGG